jgi:hypothetical protein
MGIAPSLPRRLRPQRRQPKSGPFRRGLRKGNEMGAQSRTGRLASAVASIAPAAPLRLARTITACACSRIEINRTSNRTPPCASRHKKNERKPASIPIHRSDRQTKARYFPISVARTLPHCPHLREGCIWTKILPLPWQRLSWLFRLTRFHKLRANMVTSTRMIIGRSNYFLKKGRLAH